MPAPIAYTDKCADDLCPACFIARGRPAISAWGGDEPFVAVYSTDLFDSECADCGAEIAATVVEV